MASMARNQPQRYAIEGTTPTVVCHDWPNIFLHVERGLAVSQEQLTDYPRQCIFLDGVFTGPAFLDNDRRQYSLDHHAGCVRAFTLAACEQACVLLVKGIPLWDGEWHVYVNEPDLDAMLAAWVLLNHHALSHDDFTLLRKVMPLIRTEGVIDSLGFNNALLSGLPRRIYEAHKRRIDKLRREEQQLRESRQWTTVDPLEFGMRQLEQLDQHLFPRGRPRTGGVEAQSQAALPSRKLALLVRSQRGIYEVELSLKEQYGPELALIVLDADEGRMTLRQVDAFLPRNLNNVYPVLNTRDPFVETTGANNSWGGSEIIGGSPRKSGTGLTGQQVLEISARVLRGEEAPEASE